MFEGNVWFRCSIFMVLNGKFGFDMQVYMSKPVCEDERAVMQLC